MSQVFSKQIALKLSFIFAPVFIIASFLAFCSFTANRLADDFLKQLGISKAAADEKITGAFLGGGFDPYGLKNAKNIALGNRKAIILDVLAYAKVQASGPAFIKQYTEMKNRAKPTESTTETPEAFKAANIARAKKFVADTEASLKKADAGMKPVFEKLLTTAQKNLQEAEDPNNKMYTRYAANYEGYVKMIKENYSRQMAEWEKRYPTNQLLYVKMRLQEFMDVTKDIDFGAELFTKNGKKYFVNPAYESKGYYWKMAFRAGKEAVEPAREFVQKWIEEIK
jgi:hypothetical protein